MQLPQRRIIVFLCALALTFSSCWLFQTPSDDGPDSLPGAGAVLVAHRGRLYNIGGMSSAGSYSDGVRMATIGEDGGLSSWIDATSLPSPRAYAAVFASADYLYIAGGQDETGFLDDVWYAWLAPDGSLGGRWTKSAHSLPAGRAGAASFIIAGRLYVAGGEGPDGASAELFSAAVWRDGRPGLWSPGAHPLPSPRVGAAALRLGDNIYLAGGLHSSTYSAEFLSAGIDATGTLGAWSSGPRLPDARAFAAVLPWEGFPAVLGGATSAGVATRAYILGASSAWERISRLDGIRAGPAAIAHGNAYLFQSAAKTASDAILETGARALVGRIALPAGLVDTPTARLSGGGYVAKNEAITLFAGPGDTIRYTLTATGVDPADPDASSSIYDPTKPVRIANDSVLAVRSFHAGQEPSEILRMSFRLLSTGMVYTIEKALAPSPDYQTCLLQETYSDGSTKPMSYVWYALQAPARGWYELDIRDADDDASAWTDRVHLTLFEGEALGLARDSEDRDIDRREDDLAVWLDPGTYRARIASVGGATGGCVGLRFARAGAD